MQNKTNLCNHVPYLCVQSCTKETRNLWQKNIQMSKSKSYLDFHIVNWTITMMDKLFLQPTWLEVEIACIEVRYIEACKKNSCEGGQALGYSKPTIYAATWLPQQKQNNQSQAAHKTLNPKPPPHNCNTFSQEKRNLVWNFTAAPDPKATTKHTLQRRS